MPGMSYEALMKPGQIVKAIQRLQTPASFFTNFLKTSPFNNSPTMATDLDTFGYDVYAATRTMAPFSAPNQPPVEVGRKPISTELATLFRSHPSISIMDNEVFRSRQLGSFGLQTAVDPMGARYIAMQLSHVKTTMANSVEYMNAMMLKGGFGLKADGDGYVLCAANDANAISVNNYKIPAGNKGDIGGIIASGEEWNLASAPVWEHLSEISMLSSRISGYPVRHIVINGKTAAPLFNNTKMSQSGGSSFTIFDSLTERQVKPGTPLTSGQYVVKFRAIPQYTFHIYNEGLVPTVQIPDEASQIDSANFELLVPDGFAMMLPDPGDWVGYAVGKEVIAENVLANPKVVQGYAMWRTREIDPSRFKAKFLLKYVPLLLVPNAVIYANVWRTGL